MVLLMPRVLPFCLFAVVLTGCRLLISSDEVARVRSPDGLIEAVVLERNGGAATSFGYDVRVVAIGGDAKRGMSVASLYGAVRNSNAHGVNIRWVKSEAFVVEYLQAEQARLVTPVAVVAGRRISVSLISGILDPTAPGGGMLYNRQLRSIPNDH